MTDPRQAAPAAPALYFGAVMHERFEPVRHRFTYQVFSMLLDLDGLDALDRRLRLFSHNRFNLFSFHDRDHGAFDGTPPRARVEALLADAGCDFRPDRIALLCYPRILGFVFNPLSIYYCYRANGEIGAIVYEVRNTFGEHHAYVAPVMPDQAGALGLRQSGAKRFYVSPFIPMAARYRFTMDTPAERLRVLIRETVEDRPLLVARFTGRRRDVTDKTLLHAFLRYPLMTLKVVGAINFEAARLWLKGLRPVARTAAPEPPASLIGHGTGDGARAGFREAAE